MSASRLQKEIQLNRPLIRAHSVASGSRGSDRSYVVARGAQRLHYQHGDARPERLIVRVSVRNVGLERRGAVILRRTSA